MASLSFVQFEFTHSIGPEPGRYVIVPEPAPADEEELAVALAAPAAGATGTAALVPEPETEPIPGPAQPAPGEFREQGSADVLVLEIVGAPPASGRRLLRRRPHDATVGEPPAEVALALATVVKATEPLAAGEAAAWLELMRAEPEARERRIAEALALLNEVVAAHRTGARDPYATDLTRADARAIRIGYGDPGEVSRSRWRDAIAAPEPREPRQSRAERVAPSAAMAAILARRSETLDADELLLRALLDLEHERPRCAALQLGAALDSARVELADRALPGAIADRLDQLESGFGEVAELAARPASLAPSAEERARLLELTLELGSVIDGWRAEQAG